MGVVLLVWSYPPAAPLDVDGDSVLDRNDNCPFASNVSQRDVDGDGIGDVCDANSGADLVLGVTPAASPILLNQNVTVALRERNLGPQGSSGANFIPPSTAAFTFVSSSGVSCAQLSSAQLSSALASTAPSVRSHGGCRAPSR